MKAKLSGPLICSPWRPDLIASEGVRLTNFNLLQTKDLYEMSIGL